MKGGQDPSAQIPTAKLYSSVSANLADTLKVPGQKIPAYAAGRRIRYLDQNAEIGDQVEYGTVVLERFS